MKTTWRVTWAVGAVCVLSAALMAVACESAGGGETADVVADVVPDVVADTAPADVPMVPDTAPADVPLVPDTAPADVPMVPDTAPADVPVVPDVPGDTSEGPYGFTIRIPQERQAECEGWEGPVQVVERDQDWVCTFDYDGVTGYVYIQSNLTSCWMAMSAVPEFSGVAGFISVGGVVTPVADPGYDWGGNHHNEALSFGHLGKSFRYYHSSFGWGFHSCHPMDCMQVMEGETVVEDGCGSDLEPALRRTLPAVCVQVTEDGAVPELVDTFSICDGDPFAR